MSIGRIICLLVLVCVSAALTAGCTSYTFGDVAYADDTLHVMVNSGDEPRQVTVQVTIFDTTGFAQAEVYRKAEYLDLVTGGNEYLVPISLRPGTYKIYLYIMVDGARTTSVIRDITVP
ncbi:MAG: hypothetical protein APR53_05265 [Methanoculleus sp. SDB]|nr:MAG: hypothetical protein APR53_05265 [Methanoculleus sp. SDB]